VHAGRRRWVIVRIRLVEASPPTRWHPILPNGTTRCAPQRARSQQRGRAGRRSRPHGSRSAGRGRTRGTQPACTTAMRRVEQRVIGALVCCPPRRAREFTPGQQQSEHDDAEEPAVEDTQPAEQEGRREHERGHHEHEVQVDPMPDPVVLPWLQPGCGQDGGQARRHEGGPGDMDDSTIRSGATTRTTRKNALPDAPFQGSDRPLSSIEPLESIRKGSAQVARVAATVIAQSSHRLLHRPGNGPTQAWTCSITTTVVATTHTVQTWGRTSATSRAVVTCSLGAPSAPAWTQGKKKTCLPPRGLGNLIMLGGLHAQIGHVLQSPRSACPAGSAALGLQLLRRVRRVHPGRYRWRHPVAGRRRRRVPGR